MKLPVHNLGQHGLVTDVESEDIAPNAFSKMQNIRCQRNKIVTFGGSTQIIDPTGNVQYLVSLPTPTSYFLCYPQDVDGDTHCEAIYTYGAAAQVDRTNTTDYALGYSDNGRWNGCTLHGLAILNNYVDAPQWWSGVPASMADFDTFVYSGSNDWDDYAGGGETYRAKVIRSHKNYLWAIGIVDDGTDLPHTVHRSGPATPGNMPTSWDYSSTSDRSIRAPLADSQGECVDGLSLRDSFIIYKEDMVYRADFIGGVLQEDLNPLFKDRGLLATDCVVDIGGRHVCLGDGRLYVHDGHVAEDILEGRNADYLFDAISEDYYENTFLSHHTSKSEVWIHYPTTSAYCDKALVWNYKTNTFYPRNTPNLRHALTGLIVNSDGQTWGDRTGVWADYTGAWNERAYSPIADTLIGAGEKILEFDSGNLEDTAVMECYAQHDNLNLGGDGEWNMITAIYPRASGDAFDIDVGSQDGVNGAITWHESVSFDPATDKKANVRSTGPFHAIRFRSNADVAWNVSGYTVHYEYAGHE